MTNLLMELFVIHSNTWNHLTLLTYGYKSYIYMYKKDLALNNQQGLISHKIQQTKSYTFNIYV